MMLHFFQSIINLSVPGRLSPLQMCFWLSLFGAISSIQASGRHLVGSIVTFSIHFLCLGLLFNEKKNNTNPRERRFVHNILLFFFCMFFLSNSPVNLPCLICDSSWETAGGKGCWMLYTQEDIQRERKMMMLKNRSTKKRATRHPRPQIR